MLLRNAAAFDRLFRSLLPVSWPGISFFAPYGEGWGLWPSSFLLRSSRTPFASSDFPCLQTMSIRASSQVASCIVAEVSPSSSYRSLFSFLSCGCCGDMSNGTVTTHLTDRVLRYDRGAHNRNVSLPDASTGNNGLERGHCLDDRSAEG